MNREKYWYHDISRDQMLDYIISPKCKQVYDDWLLNGCTQCNSHESIIRRHKIKNTEQEYWKITCTTKGCTTSVFKPLNIVTECEGHSV